MNKVVSLVICIFLVSCAVNSSNLESKELVNNEEVHSRLKTNIIPLDLPSWFLIVPQDKEVALSISPCSQVYPERTTENLKCDASVTISRNRSSVVIAKMKIKDNERIGTPVLVGFDLQVTKDIDSLMKIYKKTNILKSHKFKGNMIGLVSCESEIEVNEDIVEVLAPPTWFGEAKLINKVVISSGKATATSPDIAYKNAYKKAVKKLAMSQKSKVKSMLYDTYDDSERFGELNTSLLVENLKNTRNSLILRKTNSAFVYDAYVEVRWVPVYKFKEIK